MSDHYPPRLRRLARNAALNFAGHAAPLAAAVAAIPYLANTLGTDRFGLLAIAWVLVGYFSLFDLGLGRALSREVARRHGAASESGLPAIVRSALLGMLALGALAGFGLYGAAAWLCRDVLNIDASLQEEATQTLHVVAVSLPFVTTTSGLRGLLEAGQRFGLINAIRIPFGLLNFLGPMAVVAVAPNMIGVAAMLALLRIAAAVAHWIPCRRLFPRLLFHGSATLADLAELLRYGSWLTVSNIVGPFLVYVDRFLIGSALSLTAVAYYAAPYEVVTRLWIIPAAVTGVLFPAVASSYLADPARTLHIYRWGIKAIFVAVYPLVLFVMMLAPQWLQLWLGAEYARASTLVVQILALGLLVNCLAHIPFMLLQAAGRADLTAKLHVIELPAYLLLLVWLLPRAGIEGAALAWSVRCILDAAVLFIIARRFLPASPPVLRRSQGALMVLLVALTGGAFAMPASAAGQVAIAIISSAASMLLAWFVLLGPEERRLLVRPSELWRVRQ
ncbi:MAG: hypothetical protein A3H27_03825 [Acidobacteria bacterium RIFCSPLOWO2_02_FULL_59_13]|nr:MAG: hypothetical protein A3H27_03825 [Acidobacteria bacterium RIFCSPLOWO2_02_FULL_59_13]